MRTECPGGGMKWRKNKFNLLECPVCHDIWLADALRPGRRVPAHFEPRKEKESEA